MKALVKQKVLERRSKSRVEAKMRIRINGEYEDIKTFHGNISRSGIYIETIDLFAELGSKVHLELFMSQSETVIKLRGKIVRMTKPNQVGSSQGLAIQFQRIDPKHIKLLDKYIDYLFDSKGIGCRKSPRVSTHVLVEVKNDESTYQAMADNLGHGGLFLKMPSGGFSIGDRINLVIVHPSSRRRFFVEAEIVHLRSGQFKENPEFIEGVGVEFINLSDQRRKDLIGFLRSVLHYQRRARD